MGKKLKNIHNLSKRAYFRHFSYNKDQSFLLPQHHLVREMRIVTKDSKPFLDAIASLEFGMRVSESV